MDDVAQVNGRAAEIIVPGRNCWRIEQCDRLALIVDAADYFRVAKEAILKARHVVYLIGWDFDTRIRFEPGGKTLEGPDRLGPFLRWLDRHRPGLRIYVLKWDLGALQTLSRGTTPLFVLNLMTSKRVRFQLDSAHPLGAAHHQKIVVIDDVIAFCGGLDMTANRWDTRRHLDDDPRRQGRHHGPWHDATTAVDGAAARAIGDIARERWRRATGRTLDPPPAAEPIWPRDIRPTFRDVPVAIARTIPEYEQQPEVREIEHLYLDGIRSARRAIYCETQYFASDAIVAAMAERLAEEDGPEIVIINPKTAHGEVESEVMDSRRERFLKTIAEADRFGRFRIFYPVTRQGRPVYVHAKILVVDDRLLRVGSSNVNNRSMGFDTECDVAVEAGADDADRRATIAAVRDDLIAEHFDLDPQAVAQKLDESGGSLVTAIDALRQEAEGSGRRTMVPLVPDENGPFDEIVAESVIADPDHVPKPWRALVDRLKAILP
ncbi:MAG: phospholipase D-like domain-containing protein [Pararhizobium sp.]